MPTNLQGVAEQPPANEHILSRGHGVPAKDGIGVRNYRLCLHAPAAFPGSH